MSTSGLRNNVGAPTVATVETRRRVGDSPRVALEHPAGSSRDAGWLMLPMGHAPWGDPVRRGELLLDLDAEQPLLQAPRPVSPGAARRVSVRGAAAGGSAGRERSRRTPTPAPGAAPRGPAPCR